MQICRFNSAGSDIRSLDLERFLHFLAWSMSGRCQVVRLCNSIACFGGSNLRCSDYAEMEHTFLLFDGWRLSMWHAFSPFRHMPQTLSLLDGPSSLPAQRRFRPFCCLAIVLQNVVGIRTWSRWRKARFVLNWNETWLSCATNASAQRVGGLLRGRSTFLGIRFSALLVHRSSCLPMTWSDLIAISLPHVIRWTGRLDILLMTE